MMMYETSKSPEIMADAILCLKSKMAANEPEVVISSKLWHISSKFQRRTYGIRPWQIRVQCNYLGDYNNERQSEMAAETGNA